MYRTAGSGGLCYPDGAKPTTINNLEPQHASVLFYCVEHGVGADMGAVVNSLSRRSL